MSKIARFSYKALATIYPVKRDDWTNSDVYGTPYLIDCSWERTDGTATDANGNEVSNTITVYTELLHKMQPVQRPEKGWMLATGDTTAIADPLAAGANFITGIVEWDMSMFNDTPDYKIVTGG
ncbi:TPA: hypothetical protein ACHJ7J_000240 [Escherichia coli]